MSDLKKIAAHGIKGDRMLGHLTRGDAVVPAEAMQHPATSAAIHAVYQAHGLDPNRFLVGAPNNSRNPTTKLRQFEDGGGGDGGDGGGGEGSGGEGDGPGPGAAPGSVGDRAGPGASSTAVSGMSPSDARGFLGTSPSADPQGYGDRSLFSGTAGSFGQPTTGFGFLDSRLNNAVNNPGSTIGGMALNALIPGLGPLSALSDIFGGPTTQSALAAMAAHGQSGPPGANDGSGGHGGGASPYMPLVGNQTPGQIAAAAPGLAAPSTGPPGVVQTPIPPPFGSTIPLDTGQYLRAWQARQAAAQPPQNQPMAAFGLPTISPDMQALIQGMRR